MTTPKLLSREELAARIGRIRRSFASFGNEFSGLLDLALGEVEGHIAGLEADNAALWRLADHAMAAHVGAREKPHLLEATRVLAAHRPGVHLLEEHRRALVRAKNEILDKAAAEARSAAECHCGNWHSCTCNWESKLDSLEDDILALKEKEA